MAPEARALARRPQFSLRFAGFDASFGATWNALPGERWEMELSAAHRGASQ